MGSTLRIGFLSTLYHSSHLLRQARSVERELRLDCNWRLYGTGPEMMEAFGHGDLDLGYVGLPPAVIGISSGIPVVCVGGGHVEGTVMLGPAEFRDLETCGGFEAFLGQFHGLRIGVPGKGSIHDVIFRDLLGRHPGAEVEIVNYSWADLIPRGLRKGEIHGAVGTPPLAVLCERRLGTRILVPPGEFWPFNPSYGIVAGREWISGQSGQLLEDFLRVNEEACNLIREDPKEAARSTVLALPGLDETFVQRVYGISPHYCASLPEAYVRATLEFLPVLARLGYLREPPPANEIFELRYIEAVHPGPHHYRDAGRRGSASP